MKDNTLILEYAKLRFIKSNHPKYHKYCNIWIENLTDNQKKYLIDEQKRKEFLNFKQF